ncbi:hypothetical protein Bca4012_023299 [Brassica carinata]
MGKWKNRPQVFINFRGKDVRKKLLPHLKHHLKDRNVNVFTDDDAFGEQVEKIFKYIKRSRIVIVIFSINYLESHWCLDELVEIKKCLECEKLDFAIPIFYKVETSHVKKLSGKFGKKFVALQEKYRKSKVNRWKKALRYVAKSIGLAYEKGSSISELDFIKKIVERVDFTLTKIASKDKNSPETSKGEASNLTDVHHLNEMIHSSRTLEALQLERSYYQGFMVGSAWKDAVISSMHSSSPSFRISHPGNPLQFRGYNWGCSFKAFLSLNFGPFVEVPRWNRILEPKMYQGYRRSSSYHDIHNNIDQYHPSPYEIGFNQYPNLHHQACLDNNCRFPLCDKSKDECSMSFQPSMEYHMVPTSNDAEKQEDKTICISLLCYFFERCFSYIGSKIR